MSSPSFVTSFLDAETRPGTPDTAVLARRLARWQRWARERMTGQVPCSSRVNGPSATLATPVTTWSRFYVPAPPTPNRMLRVWWRAAYPTGTLGIRSSRTGTVQWIAATDYGGLSSGTVTVDAPDVLEVLCKHVGSAPEPYYPTFLSAWWETLSSALVPGATFEGWSAVSQNFYAAGRSDSAYLLRWLARKANYLTSDRQRCVYSNSDNGPGAYGIFRISAKLPSVRVWVYAKASADRNISVVFYDTPGAGLFTTIIAMGSIAVPGDDTWAWRSVTIPCGFATGHVVHMSVSQPNTSIASVSVEEDQYTAAALGLPAGETVPAAFVDLDDALLLGGMPIVADTVYGGSRARGRKVLVENMIWLAANKVRTLWSRSVWSPGGTYGQAGYLHPANTTPLDFQTLDVVRYRATPDGWAKQLRIASGAFLRSGYSTTTQGVATGHGLGDDGATATKLLSTVVPASLMPSWTVEEAPAVAAGQAFTFRRILVDPPAVGQAEIARSDGLTIEELPMGTPTTAWT
jgi:hypothetical protein